MKLPETCVKTPEVSPSKELKAAYSPQVSRRCKRDDGVFETYAAGFGERYQKALEILAKREEREDSETEELVVVEPKVVKPDDFAEMLDDLPQIRALSRHPALD